MGNKMEIVSNELHNSIIKNIDRNHSNTVFLKEQLTSKVISDFRLRNHLVRSVDEKDNTVFEEMTRNILDRVFQKLGKARQEAENIVNEVLQDIKENKSNVMAEENSNNVNDKKNINVEIIMEEEIEDKIPDFLECPVCMEVYTMEGDRRPIALECGHSICGICLPALKKRFCPICRCCIPEGSSYHTIMIDMIKLIQKKYSKPEVTDEMIADKLAEVEASNQELREKLEREKQAEIEAYRIVLERDFKTRIDAEAKTMTLVLQMEVEKYKASESRAIKDKEDMLKSCKRQLRTAREEMKRVQIVSDHATNELIQERNKFDQIREFMGDLDETYYGKPKKYGAKNN